MTVLNIIGLDLSLTATGVAWANTVDIWHAPTLGVDRLAWYRTALTTLLVDERPNLVAVEGYAFGRPNQATHLGELGGVMRLAIADLAMRYVDVPPPSLKKYATSRGNAKKIEMVIAARERLGYDGHDDNEADALWLRAMALDAYGHPVVDLPQTHRVALDKIAWPELLEPAA